jgi:hypothetical protein
MSRNHHPRLRDPLPRRPPAPASCAWQIGPHRFVQTIWTEGQWAELPEADRPPRAQYIAGIGWSVMRYAGPADVPVLTFPEPPPTTDTIIPFAPE